MMLVHCDACSREGLPTIYLSPDSSGVYSSPSYYLPYDWVFDGTKTFCGSECAAVARSRVH